MRQRLRRWVLVAVGLRMIASAAPAAAGLLPIQLDPTQPTVISASGTVTYDAATGNFHGAAVPISYTSPAFPSLSIVGGTTVIDLFVDASGAFASSGTGLSLTGSMDLDGDGTDDVSGALLIGTMLNFGAEPAGPPTRVFNGLFSIDGGALTGPILLSGGGSASAEFGIGRTGGFRLSVESVTQGILGDFGASFAGDSSGDVLGVVAVPVPATLLLLASAVTALGAARAWRRH